MKQQLKQYKAEAAQELTDILTYWMSFAVDKENGGFAGRIDHSENRYNNAPKGSVLNSRILWSFSAAYQQTGNVAYLAVATKAFHYLLDFFIDKEYGGVYWTVNADGNPLDTKKQIYALSFAIYGLSEYAAATQNEVAKETAIELFHVIVKYSYDENYGGYLEAVSRDWKELPDLRLSAKDANERKSMNTHLHVLEGFANLYRVWPDAELKDRIAALIKLFLRHIISPQTHHLQLFFADDWTPKSTTISYGHDIEAAWLIQEAAEVIGDAELLTEVKKVSINLATAAAKGLADDGGLWYEYEPEEQLLITQKHWWPQAEAMVGFFNAWQLTGDEKWLLQSLKSWAFIKDRIKDNKVGEWVWGIEENYTLMNKEDKVGVWKCPYHNSRACLEIIKRVSATIETDLHLTGATAYSNGN